MKDWVSSWKASGKTRKQRKYVHQAPLHIKRTLMGTHLSKELRTKHKTRNVSVRSGDTVKVLRGQFRGKTGKVDRVLLGKLRVIVAGVETSKRDGSKVPYPLHPSNLIITDLNLSDKRRLAAPQRSA